MNDPELQQILRVLHDIRDDQRLQMERQAESFALQRNQFELALKQTERAERIPDRAEEIQAKGAEMMASGRKVLAIVLPIVIALIVYLSWLLFR